MKTQSFKILFIADIVAHVGRAAVREILPDLRKELGVDFVIANGENSTTGWGMTKGTLDDMVASGIDFFTSGNHIWKKPEFFADLGKAQTPVIRPANYPAGSPGAGHKVVETGFGRLLVVNLLGREGINANVESPFKTIDQILEETKGKYDYSFVDFHGEMTSEKVAIGYYLDGRVDVVVGTHTHVPTADARIMEKGTAFISDVGMTGPKDSILGVRSEIILKLFTTGLPQKFQVAEGPCVFNSVLVTFESGKPVAIERVDRETNN